MKHQILFIIIFLSMSLIIHSQSWETVGSSNFSDGNADFTSMSVTDGRPYVVYKDAANGNRASCKMFNGSSWENVGALGFSDGEVDDTYIYSDSEYRAFVVYKDYANAGKITAKYIYNSSSGSYWQTIRNAGFSDGEADQPSFSQYYTGMTSWCVVYKDIANGGKITVMTYYLEDPNANWYSVGDAGFSDGEVDYPSIATNEGEMYVAYKDYAHGGKITVKNSVDWVDVGSAGFSDGIANFTKIALDCENTPYVAYKDMAHSGKATVKRFNGAIWETVGDSGFSSGVAFHPRLTFISGQPCVAYCDMSIGGKIVVKRFNGSNWVTVGVEGFSDYNVSSETISVTSIGNTPYVAFQDSDTDDKLSVMKFNGSSWEYVGVPRFVGLYRSRGTSITVDPANNDIYVFFADDEGIPSESNNSDFKKEKLRTIYYKAKVMRYTQSNGIWDNFGSEDFSLGGIMKDISIKLSYPDSKVFVSFSENYCPSACYVRPSVMQYSCINKEFSTKNDEKRLSNSGEKSLSININNSIEDFALYPNPITDVLNIISKKPIGFVAIYNTLGKEVKKVSTNKTQLEVDLSVMPSGVYFVKISINNQIDSFTVIKR